MRQQLVQRHELLLQLRLVVPPVRLFAHVDSLVDAVRAVELEVTELLRLLAWSLLPLVVVLLAPVWFCGVLPPVPEHGQKRHGREPATPSLLAALRSVFVWLLRLAQRREPPELERIRPVALLLIVRPLLFTTQML